MSPPRKKQKFFLLDTIKSCFLCLQEIQEDPPTATPTTSGNIEKEDGDVVMLEEITKKEPFCLQSIFKLLQMDAGKVLKGLTTSGAMSSFESSLGNTDLSVLLCKTCIQVSSELSCLFYEWEHVQLKLDKAIQNFTEILGNSESNPDQMVQLRKKLVGPLGQLQGSIVELTRKEMLERCTGRLQKATVSKPLTVTLEKCVTRASIPMNTSGSPPVGTHPAYHCKDCGEIASNKRELFRHSHYHCRYRSCTQHTCAACGTNFSFRTSLNRHRRLHCTMRAGGTRPTQVEKDGNPKDPPTSSATKVPSSTPGGKMTANRIRKRQEVFDNREPDLINVPSPCDVYQCQACKVEFGLHSDLRKHIASVHLKDGRPDGKTSGICECGGYFADLHAHITRKKCSAHRRETDTLVDCEFCGSTLQKASLNRHLKLSCPLIDKNTAAAKSDDSDWEEDEHLALSSDVTEEEHDQLALSWCEKFGGIGSEYTSV